MSMMRHNITIVKYLSSAIIYPLFHVKNNYYCWLSITINDCVAVLFSYPLLLVPYTYTALLQSAREKHSPEQEEEDVTSALQKELYSWSTWGAVTSMCALLNLLLFNLGPILTCYSSHPDHMSRVSHSLPLI